MISPSGDKGEGHLFLNKVQKLVIAPQRLALDQIGAVGSSLEIQTAGLALLLPLVLHVVGRTDELSEQDGLAEIQPLRQIHWPAGHAGLVKKDRVNLGA